MYKNINKYLNKVIQGDCLMEMKGIPDKSVDMILCDLPYGTKQMGLSNRLKKTLERIL